MVLKRFLYYLPGVPGCNTRMLADRGLLSRFTGLGGDCVEHCITACDGPAGTGCIVALGARAGEFKPDTQTWENSGQFWVGIENNDLRPGPCDLVREVGLSGYELVLGDGQIWRVPLLRRWNPERCEHVSALPKSMRPVSGKIREVVTPQYRKQDEIAGQIWDSFLKEEAISLDELFNRASALLAMNYRLRSEEAALLGLFDSDTALRVLLHAIDIPSIEAHRERISADGLEAHEPTIEDEI